MKTEVVMTRRLFDSEISQKSKSEFFSATDLVRAGNKWRAEQGLNFFNMTDWLARDSTREFITELEKRFGTVKISGRGRGSHTWVHPYLFIDMALAISPSLKIEVYGWLYDYLIKYRNESGDSYKKMAGSIYANHSNKREAVTAIQSAAEDIRKAIGIEDWNKASEAQLKIRDRMHENISVLCDVVPVEVAVRVGIKKAVDESTNVLDKPCGADDNQIK